MQSNMLNPAVNSTLEPESEFGYGQLFGIIWRRRWWFLGVFSSAIALSVFFALREEPVYQSSMQLLVEPNFQEELDSSDLDGRPVEDSRSSNTDYATQLNLLRSETLLQRAVEQLQSQYPNLTVRDIQRSLNLFQLEEGDTATRIFEANYVSDNPALAKQVLETLQKVYLDYNLERQESRLSRGLAFINQQLDSARQNLGGSQQALEAFRQQEDLIDPEQQGLAVVDLLKQLDQEQVLANAQYQELQAQYQLLRKQVGLSPELALVQSKLSQSARYQNLLNELQASELQLAEQRTIFTDLDPSVQVLLDKRNNQIDLIQQEVGRVLGNTAAGGNLSEQELLSTGQLSQIDSDLILEMVKAQASVNSLAARRQVLSQREQELRAEFQRFPGLIAQYDRIQPEIEIERAVLQQLLQDREQLRAELARGGYNWQVVEAPAEVKQIGPDPVKKLALGGVAGIFLGGLAAFAREAMDTGVHTSEDLSKQVALPLLGILPVYTAGQTAQPDGYLSSAQPTGAIASTSTLEIIQSLAFREAVDLIYRNIQFMTASSQLTSLAITSALPAEGKSTLTLGLALTAARFGQRVLVIDGDLRRPTLHEKLGLLWDAQGLSTFLAGHVDVLTSYPLTWLNDNIDVLPAGLEPADPVQLIGSRQMQELMKRYERDYDMVLVDTPPVIGTVDALQIASYCSGVVIVAQLERASQAELNQARNLLASLNVLGIVANGIQRKRSTVYASYAEASSG